MKKTSKIIRWAAILALLLSHNNCVLLGQGWCNGNTITLQNIDHPIASETLVYKNAVSIDEIDIPLYEDLHLQISYPTDLQPNEQRPLVVLIHGGFFIGGSLNDFAAHAQRYAQAGFIAATIDYRLCKRVDCLLANITTPCGVSWANSLLPSAYVALNDAGDAIRFLQNNAAQYHINPNQIIVAGHSAGALTTMHLAYLDQDEINAICGGCGTWPDYLAESIEPVSGIKAIIPMSGMLMDINWIDADEATNISTLLLHGTHDGIAPYDYEEAIECCSGAPFPYVNGSCPIAQRLDELGGNYELITGLGCSHDIGAGGFYGAAEPEVAAFIVKTVLCQQTVQKQVQWDCSPAQTMCPPFPYDAGTPATVCPIPLGSAFDVVVDVATPAVNNAAFRVTMIDNSQLNITSTQLLTQAMVVQISDVNGKIWHKQTMQQAQLGIDCSNYADGLYIVHFFDSKGQLLYSHKVLKW
jgi:predicted esterase